MGVDHSAFVAYGAKVKLKDEATIDDLDEWLSRTGKDLDLAYVEWGSRSYGFGGGLVIGDRRSTRSIDFDHSIGKLSIVNPPTDTQHRLESAVKRGAPFAIDGSVAWWVGGHTW